ncbi:MAG TPA: methyltransferase domain-containing protein [Clostridia bacterium]|nr:methyltransferase domain-containing protein [Clostridia bacterium]
MGSINRFDDLADQYDQWFDENPLVLESELEAMRQVTPSFSRALEIGVGTGRFAEALGIGLGIEPSKQMAAYARARGIEVVSGTAETLPFEDASFDAVFMITVDCYLPRIAPVLQECRRVLTVNGNLIMGYIDIDTPLGEVYEEGKDEDPFYKNAYFRGSDEILDELDKAGFEVTVIRQTVYQLGNTRQEVREGYGDGVFVALCAARR